MPPMASDSSRTYIHEATSLGDLLRRSCSHWGRKTAALTPEGGKYLAVSYADLWDRVAATAHGLARLGLARGDRMAIIGESSMNWAVVDWAAQTLGVIVVPIYPTLPADQAQYIVRDSGSAVAVCASSALADKVAGVDGLKVVTYRPEGGSEALSELAATPEDLKPWLDGIAAIGREDVATIIYTSGTTGNPKGAVLPHRCFLSLIEGIRETIPVDETDVWFSFLPLSHVYERFAGHVLPIAIGATVGYANTLASMAGDLLAVRPTIMTCVPRFLQAFRDRVVDSVAKAPPLRRRLFHLALDQGAKRAKGGFAPLAGILDRLVGAKVRSRIGGRLRFFVSGGAALPPHVADFYAAMGLTVLQGYGLTETMAATCVNHPERNRPWTVGEPIKGVELKIAPDGEILIRGPSVMNGYHNLPDATREAIDEEGWFHSGDIGVFEGSHLKITDRKKDLLVLGNGKNVAPQPIESRLKGCEHIDEAVLFGDGMEYVCALIVPNFEHVRQFARQHGIATAKNEELIQLEPVRKLIKAEIDEVNKSLADFEKVKRYELVAAEFTVEGGELTPSLKVRRKIVKEKFAPLIAKMQRP